jgi:hypothetical protein
VSFRVPDGHYLVAYDYGMGGLWWFVKAGSAEEIRAASSELIVVDEVPAWMREDHWKSIERDDLQNPQSEASRMILAREN